MPNGYKIYDAGGGPGRPRSDMFDPNGPTLRPKRFRGSTEGTMESGDPAGIFSWSELNSEL